jgi:hypothetical protein
MRIKKFEILPSLISTSLPKGRSPSTAVHFLESRDVTAAHRFPLTNHVSILSVVDENCVQTVDRKAFSRVVHYGIVVVGSAKVGSVLRIDFVEIVLCPTFDVLPFYFDKSIAVIAILHVR